LSQINATLNTPSNQPSLRLKKWLFATLGSLLFGASITASPVPPPVVIQSSSDHFMEKASIVTSPISLADTSITITGQVVDKTTREALIGAGAFVKVSDQEGVRGTYTDAKGNFKLTQLTPQDTLHISYIGYANQEVAVSEIIHQKPLIITLKYQPIFIGSIVISRKKNIFTRIWRGITKIFRK